MGTKSRLSRVLKPASRPRMKADEYTCVVHAPALLGKDREIYGIDPDQARQLAIEFLKSLLAGMSLHDKAGKKIDIEAWR